MAQLTHAEYDALERAVREGTRLAFQRRGRREYVVIPLTLRLENGREVVDARHPTTGHDLKIYIDEIDGVEVFK
jgi:hypothetical protein